MYEPSHMYESSSQELKTVYSSSNIFEKKRAVHGEIKNLEGNIIGRTFHEEPPPPNAQYVKRTTNVPSRLSVVNDYRKEYGGKREETRPFPEKEKDLNEAKKITSRRVDHNARRALHGGQLNGEMPCEKEWDNLPASYMKKGYDSRTPSEKIYIPPSKKDAGTRKMERTMESGRTRPSSFAFQRGKVEYRKTTNEYSNRQSIPLASENKTISKPPFLKVELYDRNNKRASKSGTVRNTSDVTQDGFRPKNQKFEYIKKGDHDVTILPSNESSAAMLVNSRFQVHDSLFERIENMIEEKTYAGVIDQHWQKTMQVSDKMEIERGESRPLRNRTRMEYNPSSFRPHTELEIRYEEGKPDKVQKKKFQPSHVVEFEPIIHDTIPSRGGIDDGLHDGDGPASIENRSERVNERRFDYASQVNRSGEGMILPPVQLGKREKVSKPRLAQGTNRPLTFDNAPSGMHLEHKY
tara:strand:+ start:597 stop:1991 length:1395 start_codon:yes stop_codon:yes gene_type:complete